MVVISDTSVISNLQQIDHVHLLPDLFGKACIPPAVHQELSRMSGRQIFSLDNFPWLEVIALQDSQYSAELQTVLDAGESEAIALAIQLKADLLLIDEAKGRKLAMERGLQITGLLGVLLAAKKQNLIQAVTPLMNRLISEANFRIAQSLFEAIKQEADE